MGVRETTINAQECIDQLRKENCDLKIEIGWRKDEAKQLRRSIGTGRVYSKLRESLRFAEKDIKTLRKRVEELEKKEKSWERAQAVDFTLLNRLIQKLVEAGDAMQHSPWDDCTCEKCALWQEAKGALSFRSPSMEEREERGWRDATVKVDLLKVAEL